MMLGKGHPRTEFSISDNSVSTAAGTKGIAAVLVVTERGELATPMVIRSVTEFERYYGGLVDYSDDPLLCKRALESGSALEVSRIAHYTDITDPSTVVGDAAQGTLGATVVKAASIGSWGNGLKIVVTEASNAIADEFDVAVTLVGYPELAQTAFNVKASPSVSELAKINATLKLVNIEQGSIAVGEVTLSGGMQDYSGLTDADYVGDADSQLGIHAFDDSYTSVRICALSARSSVVDNALLAYVQNRLDMNAFFVCPNNISGREAVEYREKTGAYTGGVVIDNWIGRYIYGTLTVIDPLTNTNKDISAIGDVLGLYATKDNNNRPWFSAAGSNRGAIKNTLGVVYNLGTAARRDEANAVEVHGINPVINHQTFGPVLWGDVTAQKAQTLLRNANVADGLIAIIRATKPIIDETLFDPNDVETWRGIYRRVSAYLDGVVAERGLVRYTYDGDQDVDTVEDAVINTPDTVAAGRYKFRLKLWFISALKYVEVGIGIDNNGGLAITILDQ